MDSTRFCESIDVKIAVLLFKSKKKTKKKYIFGY